MAKVHCGDRWVSVPDDSYTLTDILSAFEAQTSGVIYQRVVNDESFTLVGPVVTLPYESLPNTTGAIEYELVVNSDEADEEGAQLIQTLCAMGAEELLRADVDLTPYNPSEDYRPLAGFSSWCYVPSSAALAVNRWEEYIPEHSPYSAASSKYREIPSFAMDQPGTVMEALSSLSSRAAAAAKLQDSSVMDRKPQIA